MIYNMIIVIKDIIVKEEIMDKIDFKKKYKNIYAPSSKTPSIVTVPKLHYITLKGIGDPNNNQSFADSIGALYALAYTISMSYKGDALVIPGFYNFTVAPLEGIWDIVEGTEFNSNDKSNLIWTIGILMPEFANANIILKAKEIAFNKKKIELIKDITLSAYEDKECCTMLHLGPYENEPATFEKMEDHAQSEGYDRIEKIHREIYLSDFRKVAPEKLKTVLRFKVAKQK